ncbi:MAG: hypothetical protein L0229_27700 [Blastocatellia bacterium]|nr:hypothetical protein [Blastocatellia bacterium]
MYSQDVAMLGPQRVGKTSLLATMWGQFDTIVGGINLALIPDAISNARLTTRIRELREVFSQHEINHKYGIMGSESDSYYTFELGRKGKNPSMEVKFADYPGGWIKNNPDFVNDKIRNSTAVIIAIDAPALMEDNGKNYLFNDRINEPMQITHIFKKEYRELRGPRLVIFAPVKCEAYLQTRESARELKDKVKDTYGNLIDHFQHLDDNIVAVITPVQTLGGFRFSRVKIENNDPMFYFRKISGDAKYSPQDSEQPLRYLLRFMLRLHYHDRNAGWPWFINIFRTLFGADEHLKEAVSEFAKGCKMTNEFEVIMGHRWLEI